MSEPISIVVFVRALPDQAQAVAQLLDAAIEPSRKEAGCLEYRYHQVVGSPNQFVFYEVWANQAALDAHSQAPHVIMLNEQAKPLLAEPLEIIYLKEKMPVSTGVLP